MLASVALVASLVKSKTVPTNSPHQKVDLSPDLVKAVTAELIKESSDSSSTAESQATIVDEDQTILLESRVKDALEYIFSTQNARLINANHAIGYVAYGLSDLIFLYPGLTGNDYLGQELKEYGQVRNAKNELVKLVQMDTRFGALQAVQGALAQDPTKRLTVLTSSNALLSMVPNLYALAAQRQPIVFHVAAQSVDQDLVVSPNVDAVLAAARNTGAILLSSSSAQEAHDMAIAAHQIAYSARLPVIHFFNGVSASKQIEKVNLTSYTHLAQLEAIKDIQDPYQVAQKALGQYKPFEYVGASDADTVLVTLRASASDSLQHAVGSTLAKVGLLNVRLFRPWSESDLIHALPKTTRRLVILEEGAGLYAFNGPLYQDVAASIRFGPLAHDQRPRLVSAQAATFDHLQAAHMVPLVKAAEHETFINLAAEPFVQSDEDIILDGTWSAVFWDLEQDGSVPAAAAHLSSHGHVKARTTRDGYHVGGPVVHTHVQAGPASKHQYIAIHNVSLVKEYDTLANAAKNPTVVLHGPWKHGDELEPVLTNEFKLKLTELNAKLYTIDAARIAQDLGLNVKSTHLVWEAVYLILHQKAKNPVEQLTRVYKEPGEKKVALVALLNDLVNAVTNELAAVELLPPWTILEINDTVLPSVPLNRLVVEPVEQQDLGRGEEEQEGEGAESGKWHKAAWQLMFNEAYKTEQAVRPDLHEKTYVIKVMVNKRLTPTSYDRNVFHLEFDTTGSNLRYELGDALGVHGHNDYQDVQAFLDWYGLDGNDVISIKHPENGNQESRTIFQLFAQTLDIFGRPSKKFYESLASFATDPAEREQLLYLVSPEGKEDFKQRVDDTTTYEDLLREFSSAKPSVEDLVRLVAPIKPRHYSIASSQKMYNNAVHLLVVAVDWETKNGKKRYGQCTRYLSNLAIGDQVTVSIKPSVMKLPPLDSQPVIMAGLGTGMAPFRAFIQERYLAKAAGKKIGPVVLYFGSRHRSMEYLYGEELEAYHADGTLSHMGLAFSRDQKEKIYIQHKMKEDADILADYLLNQKGHFYLCGPTWPVPDVKDAVVHGLVKFGGVDAAKASALIEEWKEKETYILEVY